MAEPTSQGAAFSDIIDRYKKPGASMSSIRYRGQTDHTNTQKDEKGDFRHWNPP
jgi:hypothetical protein